MSEAKERKLQRQYDNIPIFVNQVIKENKDIKARMEKKAAEEQAEKIRQETTGVVTKPTKLGRKAYSMRKTDF